MKANAYQETYFLGDGSTKTYYVLEYGLISALGNGVCDVTTTDKDSFSRLLKEERYKKIKIVEKVPSGRSLSEFVDYIPNEGGSGRFRALIERKPIKFN